MAQTGAVLLLQLDPEAPPGLIEPLVAEAGLALQVVEGAGTVAPGLAAEAAGLVVLGSGAAGVIGPDHPAVATVRAWLETGRPVLALDAGAQVLALALGGTVRAGESHEFGYVDIAPTATGEADPVIEPLGRGLPVMEWHDDAIDLPEHAEILALCIRARVQAFRAGSRVYGLRFHPGATGEIIRRWAAIRGRVSNNPAIRVRNGAEIIRHQDRAERCGRALVEAWIGLLR